MAAPQRPPTIDDQRLASQKIKVRTALVGSPVVIGKYKMKFRLSMMMSPGRRPSPSRPIHPHRRPIASRMTYAVMLEEMAFVSSYSEFIVMTLSSA